MLKFFTFLKPTFEWVWARPNMRISHFGPTERRERNICQAMCLFESVNLTPPLVWPMPVSEPWTSSWFTVFRELHNACFQFLNRRQIPPNLRGQNFPLGVFQVFHVWATNSISLQKRQKRKLRTFTKLSRRNNLTAQLQLRK